MTYGIGTVVKVAGRDEDGSAHFFPAVVVEETDFEITVRFHTDARPAFAKDPAVDSVTYARDFVETSMWDAEVAEGEDEIAARAEVMASRRDYEEAAESFRESGDYARIAKGEMTPEDLAEADVYLPGYDYDEVAEEMD